MTTASFQSGMTRSEMGFLYKATDYSDYDAAAGSRIADAQDYFIYHFDLADGVKEAKFDVTVKGDYQIEVSSDYLHWTVVAKGKSEDKTTLRFDAPILSRKASPCTSVSVTRHRKIPTVWNCTPFT